MDNQEINKRVSIRGGKKCGRRNGKREEKKSECNYTDWRLVIACVHKYSGVIFHNDYNCFSCGFAMQVNICLRLCIYRCINIYGKVI